MTDTLSTRVSRALQPLFGNDPFGGLQKEMDDLMERYRTDWRGERFPVTHIPAADVYETDAAVHVCLDVPGFQADEIEIEVSGSTLRVSGAHKAEAEQKGRTYHCIERRSGSFARAITLPVSVKDEKVTAECKDGVLNINLPKTEAAKTHRVTVKNVSK